MLSGLVSQTGPTLNVPVQDSKERNSEQKGQKFSDVLSSKKEQAPQKTQAQEREQAPSRAQATSSKPQAPKREEVAKTEPRKTDTPQASVERRSAENTGKVESQDDSENRTDGPPDPKVMDPRTSALKAKRDQAIRKFMDSFEGEFGIPPEEMVVAMSQLTAQDLEKPPEQTVDNLLAELQIAPQDELKAKKMYLGLLMQLKQIDTRAAVPQPQDEMLSQLSAQRIHLNAEKKDVLAGQVQNLSDKFWMKGAHAEKAMTPEMNQLQVREFLKKMVTAESAGLDQAMLQEAQTLQNATASTDALLNQLKAENPELLQQDGEELQVKPEIAFMPQAQQMKPMQQSMTQGQNGQGNMDQNTFAQPQEGMMLKKPITQEAVAAEFKKLGIKMVEQPQEKKLSKADSEMMLQGDLSSLNNLKLDQLTTILPVANTQPTVEMSPNQKIENVQQIMNQAQILLKKGGGEVKVEMTPEGMGSIQMKLQVLDGKVQLQMNTETKEAKQLIESSMHDLKQSLAAQQLSIHLVKVDVVSQTNTSQNTQNDLQNQMQNFMNQQQRDGTKQFWQQFNENFGNRQARDNFIDAQNIKSPMRNQTLPGFDSSSSIQGRARTDGRGKSLNLVA